MPVAKHSSVAHGCSNVMSPRLFSRVAGAIVLWTVFPYTRAQEPLRKPNLTTSVDDSYWTALDSVLPLKPVPLTAGRGRAFSLTLRYVRAFHPESEIRFALDLDSSPVVEYVWLDHRIADLIQELFDKGAKITSEEVIKASGVNRKSLNVTPAKLTEWQEQFLRGTSHTLPELAAETRRFYKTREIDQVPDSDIIDFSYEEGETRLEGRFTEPTASTWIKWANSVQGEVARSLGQRGR